MMVGAALLVWEMCWRLARGVGSLRLSMEDVSVVGVGGSVKSRLRLGPEYRCVSGESYS